MRCDWSTGGIPDIPILVKQTVNKSHGLDLKDVGTYWLMFWALLDKARGALMPYGVQGCQQWKSLAWREK